MNVRIDFKILHAKDEKIVEGMYRNITNCRMRFTPMRNVTRSLDVRRPMRTRWWVRLVCPAPRRLPSSHHSSNRYRNSPSSNLSHRLLITIRTLHHRCKPHPTWPYRHTIHHMCPRWWRPLHPCQRSTEPCTRKMFCHQLFLVNTPISTYINVYSAFIEKLSLLPCNLKSLRF